MMWQLSGKSVSTVQRIILIDNYVDDTVLALLDKREAIIYV